MARVECKWVDKSVQFPSVKLPVTFRALRQTDVSILGCHTHKAVNRQAGN